MKRLLNAYYNVTVIPAIILTCLSSLGMCAFNVVNYGIPSTSIKDLAIVFFMFISLMTIEDIYTFLKTPFFTPMFETAPHME